MNVFDDITKPSLTEPGVKYFLNETLKKCHTVREVYHNNIFNIGLLLLFIIILGMLLIYKYKGQLSVEELEQKNTEKQQYILSKIRNYQDAKLHEQQTLITGLPHWKYEYDSVK